MLEEWEGEEGEEEVRRGEGGEGEGEGRAAPMVERPAGPSPSQPHVLSMSPHWSRLWYLLLGQGARLTGQAC